jgi:hypothetical protein
MPNPPKSPLKPAAIELLRQLRTDTLADLGPVSRLGTLTASQISDLVTAHIKTHSLGSIEGRLLESLGLLWHDHLDLSHQISQEIKTVEGSYVHGMMHRREPDYWNSKYWFRNAGALTTAAKIGEQIHAVLGADNSTSKAVVTENALYSPSNFVDACESASTNSSEPSDLKKIQEIEFEVLIDHLHP